MIEIVFRKFMFKPIQHASMHNAMHRPQILLHRPQSNLHRCITFNFLHFSKILQYVSTHTKLASMHSPVFGLCIDAYASCIDAQLPNFPYGSMHGSMSRCIVFPCFWFSKIPQYASIHINLCRLIQFVFTQNPVFLHCYESPSHPNFTKPHIIIKQNYLLQFYIQLITKFIF